jgi:hypothetical protein
MQKGASFNLKPESGNGEKDGQAQAAAKVPPVTKCSRRAAQKRRLSTIS